MDTNPAPTKPKHLRALLDGRPVGFGALAAAVWNGTFSDLSRVEVALSDRRYLNEGDEPVPEELEGYPPVSSEFIGKEGRSCH